MAAAILQTPDDVLLEILLELENAQDLSNAIQSSKRFLQIYNDHERLLLREVTFYNLSQIQALDQAKKMTSCIPQTTTGTEHKILIYEVLRPRMDILICRPRNRPQSYKWALHLYRLYHTLSPTHPEALPLLNTLYENDFLHKPKFFNPTGPFPHGNRPPLDKAHFALLEELITHHQTTTSDPSTALTVRKEVWTRLNPTLGLNYSAWTDSLLTETNHVHGPNAAAELAWGAYTGYQHRNFRGRTQDEWAHLVLVWYRRAGRAEEALALQRNHLNTLAPGTAKYVKWGRQFVVTLKRMGRGEEALRLKHEMWQHIRPSSRFYFGWSRELASEYRMQNRMRDARDVVEVMLRNCEENWRANPRDSKVRYHAEQAERAMAIEDPGFAWSEYRRTMVAAV